MYFLWWSVRPFYLSQTLGSITALTFAIGGGFARFRLFVVNLPTDLLSPDRDRAVSD